MNEILFLDSNADYNDNKPSEFKNNIYYPIDYKKKFLKIALRSIRYFNKFKIKLFTLKIEFIDYDKLDFYEKWSQQKKNEIYVFLKAFYHKLHALTELNKIQKYKSDRKRISSKCEELNMLLEDFNEICCSIFEEFHHRKIRSTSILKYVRGKITNQVQYKNFLKLNIKNDQVKAFKKNLEKIFENIIGKIDSMYEKTYLNLDIYLNNSSIDENDCLNDIKNQLLLYNHLIFFDEFQKNLTFSKEVKILSFIKYFPKDLVKINYVTNTINFEFKKKENIIINNFYISTNITGFDSCNKKQFLKIIKVLYKTEDYIEQTFENIFYIPITKSFFNCVQIYIKDINNNFIEFDRGPVICEVEIIYR